MFYNLYIQYYVYVYCTPEHKHSRLVIDFGEYVGNVLYMLGIC